MRLPSLSSIALKEIINIKRLVNDPRALKLFESIVDELKKVLYLYESLHPQTFQDIGEINLGSTQDAILIEWDSAIIDAMPHRRVLFAIELDTPDESSWSWVAQRVSDGTFAVSGKTGLLVDGVDYQYLVRLMTEGVPDNVVWHY